MTAGIQGTGPYSRLRDLRFQVRNLANEVALKPMGVRRRREKEALLRALRQELWELNREIRNAKKPR